MRAESAAYFATRGLNRPEQPAAEARHTPTQEIIVRPDGCASVFGELAHRLWAGGSGDYPKTAAGKNRFFVLELTQPERGDRWTMVAAQTTREGAMRYMDASGRVLVEIEDSIEVEPKTPLELAADALDTALCEHDTAYDSCLIREASEKLGDAVSAAVNAHAGLVARVQELEAALENHEGWQKATAKVIIRAENSEARVEELKMALGVISGDVGGSVPIMATLENAQDYARSILENGGQP
jgi:hypothetical protein